MQPQWTYRDFTIPLASGDRLLLYTDGVSEAANKQAEEFGYQRIAAAAVLATASAADCQRWVMEEVMTRTLRQLLVDVLMQAGVRHIYGLSGDSLNGITDALRATNRIQWIHVRHEETAKLGWRRVSPGHVFPFSV